MENNYIYSRDLLNYIQPENSSPKKILFSDYIKSGRENFFEKKIINYYPHLVKEVIEREFNKPFSKEILNKIICKLNIPELKTYEKSFTKNENKKKEVNNNGKNFNENVKSKNMPVPNKENNNPNNNFKNLKAFNNNDNKNEMEVKVKKNENENSVKYNSEKDNYYQYQYQNQNHNHNRNFRGINIGYFRKNKNINKFSYYNAPDNPQNYFSYYVNKPYY